MSYTPGIRVKNDNDPTGTARLVRWAVCLTIAAALVHGLNVREHLAEWWGYGVFFLFAAAAQFVYGLVLLVKPWDYDVHGGRRDGARYARRFYLGGALLNGFLIALYLVTRTVGIPLLGPAAGQTEPFTVAGVATKVIEGLLVWALVRLASRSAAREPIRTTPSNGGAIIEASNERGQNPIRSSGAPPTPNNS
ncbi:MAG TPA: hypothetical protein VHJ78_01020 [Actinomycetota bacterium]|nr:hypothetical protein [Actinomycetota bacterium]